MVARNAPRLPRSGCRRQFAQQPGRHRCIGSRRPLRRRNGERGIVPPLAMPVIRTGRHPDAAITRRFDRIRHIHARHEWRRHAAQPQSLTVVCARCSAPRRGLACRGCPRRAAGVGTFRRDGRRNRANAAARRHLCDRCQALATLRRRCRSQRSLRPYTTSQCEQVRISGKRYFSIFAPAKSNARSLPNDTRR